MKNKIYLFLAASALLLSGLLLVPALQKSAPLVKAQSSFNAYLTIDGVQGSGSGGTIEVNSWSWGATNSGIGSQSSGAGAGKVSMSDFTIMKVIDKSSPQLFNLAQSGKRAKSLVLTVNNGGSTYLTLKMSNVMVSSYGISSGGDRPTESISFTFQKIEVTY
jgi:type VI secretion system secreted protein Hcp